MRGLRERERDLRERERDLRERERERDLRDRRDRDPALRDPPTFADPAAMAEARFATLVACFIFERICFSPALTGWPRTRTEAAIDEHDEHEGHLEVDTSACILIRFFLTRHLFLRPQSPQVYSTSGSKSGLYFLRSPLSSSEPEDSEELEEESEEESEESGSMALSERYLPIC